MATTLTTRLPMERTLPDLGPGAFVRYIGKGKGAVKTGDVFVVIADKYKMVNCAPLGGDLGRYWRFPPSTIEEVAVSEIVKSDVQLGKTS